MMESESKPKKKKKIRAEDRSATYITVLEKLRLARNAKIKKIIFVLFMLVGVSMGVFFIFRALGFDINPFGRSGGSPTIAGGVAVVFLIFVLIYIVQSLTLNLIPGTTTFFITILAVNLFQHDLKLSLPIVFLISISAVLIASIPLYFMGRYGGRSLLFWLFGREALEKRLDWFARNGARGVPWLFLIPMFPTDLLCVVCGASKMKFWQYLLIVVVFRPIEVAILVFLWPFLMGEFQAIGDPFIQFLLMNMLVVNFVLLIIYHRALLGLFNKTFHFRKLEDVAAAQVAIIEAEQEAKALAEAQALALAEAITCEEHEHRTIMDEIKSLRQEIDELKQGKSKPPKERKLKKGKV